MALSKVSTRHLGHAECGEYPAGSLLDTSSPGRSASTLCVWSMNQHSFTASLFTFRYGSVDDVWSCCLRGAVCRLYRKFAEEEFEIHSSVSGLPNALDIQDIYQELTTLSSSLQDFAGLDRGVSTINREIRTDIETVRMLARTCKSDCETLLRVVGDLRVNDGRGRRFKSFKAAFAAFRKDDEIKHLEKRLAETERQITLWLCHISK